VSWAWRDWPLTWLTSHHPSVLRHCWLGHLTRKTVSEVTYNVSSGTLNTTIPYHTDFYSAIGRNFRGGGLWWPRVVLVVIVDHITPSSAALLHGYQYGWHIEYKLCCIMHSYTPEDALLIWRTLYNSQPSDSHVLIYGLRQHQPIYFSGSRPVSVRSHMLVRPRGTHYTHPRPRRS